MSRYEDFDALSVNDDPVATDADLSSKAESDGSGTSTLDNYAAITSDDVTTGANPWVNASHPTYGATGDGTTDDTQAIVDAVTAAQAEQSPVYLPAGTYSITAEIDLGGIHLFGDGMGETILSVDANTTNALTVSAVEGGVSDLTIECNSAAHKGLNITAADTFATRVESLNVDQYDTTTTTTACIAAFSATNARIHHCRVAGARAPNSGVSRGILVDGTSGSGKVEVSGCVIEDIQPTADGDGIVVQSGNPRSRIVGNTVTDAAKSAIKVNLGGENTVVTGNSLHTSPGGLSVMRIQASGVSFTGNTISQADVGGELVRVSDGAGDVTISGNTLEITGATGDCECIRVRDTEANVTIDGNAFNMHNTGRHGIQVDASTGISIGDNVLRNIGQRAINLEGPTSCSVSGNIIEGTGAHGVFVADTSSRVVITGNTINSSFEAIYDSGAVATVGTNVT